MHIIVFIRELSLGGAEKQSLLLTQGLKQHYPVNLMVWSNKTIAPRFADYIERNQLPVIFLKGNAFSKIRFMYRFFRKNKVSHLFNFLLLNNFIGGMVARFCGVPNIYGGIRNCEISSSKLFLQRVLHNFVSHKTIFNNRSGADNFKNKGFSEKKIVVIHNGIEDDHYNASTAPKRKGEDFVIFTAARFLPQKDHYTALKAMVILKARGVRFKYKLAGYGVQETLLLQWVKDLNLEDSVEILIAPPNLMELYRQADIYLSCSLKEGLSNSILEAMNASLPVVATDVGDNRYLVKSGYNGRLVTAGDFESVANEIEALIKAPETMAVMGKRSKDMVNENFSNKAFVKKYLELIEKHR